MIVEILVIRRYSDDQVLIDFSVSDKVDTMEHVGPLAVSLQRALDVNHRESEVSFVSAILSTMTRVLNGLIKTNWLLTQKSSNTRP